MFITLLTIVACTVPTAAYVGLIYWADRYEKEPFWLLSAVFLWGAVPSVIVAIIANQLLSVSVSALVGDGWSALTGATVVAPLVEETIKGFALLGVLFVRRRDIDSPLDGIIYGAMVGMGFAMVENYFYFTNEYAAGGLQAWGVNVFYRAGVFGLNHALFSGLFGLGVAIGRLSIRNSVRLLAPIFGWSIAVTLHAIHNATVGLSSALCLLAPLADWGGILMTVAIIIWALRQEQSWLQEYLKEEVLLGTITYRQYELASDSLARRAYLWDHVTHWRWGRYRKARRFLSLMSKLAYEKHHSDVHPEDQHLREIATLRQRLQEVGQQL